MQKRKHRQFLIGLVLALTHSIIPAIANDLVEMIEKVRQERDQSIWRHEKLAQEYETAFIDLWDKLRESDNPFDVLRTFSFNTIDRPELGEETKLPEKIRKWTHQTARSASYTREEFSDLLSHYEALGYHIEQTEWHHARFLPNEKEAARSEFSFSIHAKGPGADGQRYIVKGLLDVAWNADISSQGYYKPAHIGFNELQILTRDAAPTFTESLWLDSKSRSTPYSIVLVEDLNGDGFSDILFPKANTIYFNKGDFTFEESRLAHFPINGQVTAAALLDLNLDGQLEYVVAAYDAPYLFAYTYNSDTNAFDGKPFGVWKSDTPLRIQLIAAGDITGDGYPELYLGSSTPAYEDGKMPTPYFDANDGAPSYLLQNTGGLRYADISTKTDFAAKRGRRAYVASILDLNSDNRMDLVVTSDFSGIDFYENTEGTLKDRTSEWVDNRSLFGMSQSFADFDRDGHLDLLAVGMSSTTARRLERMGLGRSEYPQHQKMRMNIAYGNRLYFGNSDGVFKQSEASESLARSGWSWGSSSFDFNNDSYPDIYIANGYLSKSTARDYCTHFWTHDIYEEPKVALPDMSAFFETKGPKALVGGNQMGWNPFEKSHLYLNLSGQGFVNVAYLFGVSHGGDGRAVIGEDFDRDGRVDLLLVEQDSINAKESVYLYRNEYSESQNWIGFDIVASPGKAILGTKVRITGENFETERVYTIGEAYSGQNPSAFHFGLGETDRISRVDVHWPNGSKTSLENPAVNRFHALSP